MEFNIVVLAFNRLKPLQRLLGSLERLETEVQLNLWVSCDGGASDEVIGFVQAYKWSMGDYEVLVQPVNHGVDAHNLYAINLADEMGHVIVLEDDLIVAPGMIRYLTTVLEQLSDFSKLAGISLYRYSRVESTDFPFELIPNEESTYYMQRPCSKGCYYNREMATNFKTFLTDFKQDFVKWVLPPNVLKWGDEVWEKAFYCYLIASGQYLAFPRYSLTTDYGDKGVHMNSLIERYKHHSSLDWSKTYCVRGLSETINVYDSFYELDVDRLKALQPQLDAIQLTLDLNGTKPLETIDEGMIISRHSSSEPEKSWGRLLKPAVFNLVLNEAGEFFTLGPAQSFQVKRKAETLKEDFLYHYPNAKLMDLIRMKWKEVVSRFTS